MLQVAAIFLSLFLLIFFAYRGYSVILFAPVFALLAAAVSGLNVMPAYSELFLLKMAAYVKAFFPLFMLGAVFGKVMDESGAAKAIAKWILAKLGPSRAIISVVLAVAVLTYGGVSLFVVAFAVYPFATALFKEGGIPKRLIPASIALGAFTFTMTALPGTAQIQNLIPTKYFGTTAYAAPTIGLFVAAWELIGGLLWLEYRRRKAQAAGEGYGVHTKNESGIAVDESKLPNPLVAIVPLLVVLSINYVLTKSIPHWNLAMLKPYEKLPLANLTMASVAANWSLIIGLVAGITVAVVLGWKNLSDKLAQTLNQGTIGSLLAVMNTASEVGYGGVISSLAGFTTITNGLLAIKGSPLVSEAVAVNLLAGITGSASGGMSIALDTLGKTYLEWANRVNVSPEMLHRIAAVASGGLDVLPHNGAVITLLSITGLTHKESYIDIMMVALVNTIIAGAMGILLYSITHIA
ncbi:MAG TPA: GntP family permease [Symbiobacteriaceae bacterium]